MRSRGILLTTLCTLLIAALIVAQNTPAASPQATTATSGSPSAKIGVFVNPKNSQSTTAGRRRKGVLRDSPAANRD